MSTQGLSEKQCSAGPYRRNGEVRFGDSAKLLSHLCTGHARRRAFRRVLLAFCAGAVAARGGHRDRLREANRPRRCISSRAGHWDSIGRNALGGLCPSVHLRVVVGLCIDDAAFDPVNGHGALRYRAGIGQVGLRPVDSARIASDLEKIADRPAGIDIRIDHACRRAQPVSRSAGPGAVVSTGGANTEFTDRFLPVGRTAAATAAGGAELDSTAATRPTQPIAAPGSPTAAKTTRGSAAGNTPAAAPGTRQRCRRRPRRF